MQKALGAALQLKLFDVIQNIHDEKGEAPTSSQISHKAQLDPEATKRVLDNLAAFKIICSPSGLYF